MADKKPTPKKTPATPKVQTVEELQAELMTKQADLLNARRANAAGELANPHILTTTRKQIARLHTAIRAAELTAKESK